MNVHTSGATMNQHPDCTPNDLLHMIDAPTPRRPEDMTIEEMAAALGLRRDNRRGGWWQWLSVTGVVAEPETSNVPNGPWFSWPAGESFDGRKQHESEHAALARLYRLRFPESTTPPTPAPIVEPAPVQPPAMTPAKALSFIEAFSPCAHTSHTKVGFGHHVRCEDCETVVAVERLPYAWKRAEDFNAATDVLHRLIAGKQATEPAPVQRGGNVALVMRAYEAWSKAPSLGDALNDVVDAEFMRMLAEAYVADAKEGA